MEVSGVVTLPSVARPLRLAPFRAMMLTPRRVGDPGSARLFAKPYRSVNARLQAWQDRGQLVQDDAPALYLHEYTSGGLTVRGLVGGLDLTRRATSAADRAVLAHEGIHPVQADDLADRMTSLALNPAPILLVHRAPEAARALVRAIAGTEPERSFVDRNDQHHRVWAVRDPLLLQQLDDSLAGCRALIADGHHRFAAYLRMQRRAPGGGADHGLAMLVDQEETPLFLGPIHRVLAGVGMDDLTLAAESAGATVRPGRREDAVSTLGPDTLVVTDGRAWASVSLERPVDRAAVEVLHDEIVPALPRGPQRTHYLHTVETTLTQVRRLHGVAVLMPAPDVDLVLRIAAADRLLPEKATSFQPKPSVGVLIRSLLDE